MDMKRLLRELADLHHDLEPVPILKGAQFLGRRNDALVFARTEDFQLVLVHVEANDVVYEYVLYDSDMDVSRSYRGAFGDPERDTLQHPPQTGFRR